jgi:hypothetical protein
MIRMLFKFEVAFTLRHNWRRYYLKEHIFQVKL